MQHSHIAVENSKATLTKFDWDAQPPSCPKKKGKLSQCTHQSNVKIVKQFIVLHQYHAPRNKTLAHTFVIGVEHPVDERRP